MAYLLEEPGVMAVMARRLRMESMAPGEAAAVVGGSAPAPARSAATAVSTGVVAAELVIEVLLAATVGPASLS